MTDEQTKRRGRPPRYSAKRSTLTIRLTERMKALLSERAGAAGRSLSEEIELTLEKVFFPIDVRNI